MSSKWYPVAFHVAVFAIYAVAVYYTLLILDMPARTPQAKFGGRLKYLTVWNLILHFIVFGISTFLDLCGSRNVSLQRLRDNLFTAIAMPLGIFVFFAFWGLYFINRELIFPKALEPYYPWWLNHISHTMIFPVLLLEAKLVFHHHPSRKTGVSYLFALTSLYFVWLMFLGIYMNVWVYPILEVLNWGMRICFVLGSAVVMFVFYWISENITSSFWGFQAPVRTLKMK